MSIKESGGPIQDRPPKYLEISTAHVDSSLQG